MTQVAKLRHEWGAPQRFANKTERQCCRCGLVKVTKHEAEARPPHWTEYWMGAARVDDGRSPNPRAPACRVFEMNAGSLVDEVAAIVGALSISPASPETVIQEAAASALASRGLLVGREQTLGSFGRIDIIVRDTTGASVGVEVKRNRPGPEVAGQIARYAASGLISQGLVLLCERAVSLPEYDLPVRVVGFGRSGGIAL
jgi:hypothetical protein